MTLSCWEVFGGRVLDLLADGETSPPLAGGIVRTFVELRISTIGDAKSLMRLCKARSVNWLASKAESELVPEPLPNRAHAFVRLHLYSPQGDEGHVSSTLRRSNALNI